MTISKTLTVVALALVGLTAPDARAQAVRSDQQILIQLERDWDEALRRNDVQFVANVLADEFQTTYSDGSRGDRARELAGTADFNQHIESTVLDDFTVRIYGDNAVVSFTQHLNGISQGNPKTVVIRVLDVFVLRDGRWQCVASQSTKSTS